MRLYSFVNFYLSSIQQGIQTGHLSDEMSVKYLINLTNTPRSNVYVDWITNHKTYITLNGGANTDIMDTYLRLEHIGTLLGLPYGRFHEDFESLNNVMTCCGIVVPKCFYDAIDYRKFPRKIEPTENYFYIEEGKKDVVYNVGTPEWELIKLIKSCSLAR